MLPEILKTRSTRLVERFRRKKPSGVSEPTVTSETTMVSAAVIAFRAQTEGMTPDAIFAIGASMTKVITDQTSAIVDETGVVVSQLIAAQKDVIRHRAVLDAIKETRSQNT